MKTILPDGFSHKDRIVKFLFIFFPLLLLFFGYSVIALIETWDTAFSGGFVRTDNPMNLTPNTNEYGYGVARQDDGKVIVISTATDNEPGSYNYALISRYNTNGSLDNTFGTNGVVKIGAPGSYYYGDDIALTSEGKIVAVGTSTDSGDREGMTVWRLNSNGSFDTSFGTGGTYRWNDISMSSQGSKIMVLEDNSLIIGGIIYSEYFYPSSRVTAWKLKPGNGTLDESFGLSATPGMTYYETSYTGGEVDIERQSDGKFIVSGRKIVRSVSPTFTIIPTLTLHAQENPPRSLSTKLPFPPIYTYTYPAFLMRLTTDGKIDTTFGNVDPLDGHGEYYLPYRNNDIWGIMITDEDSIMGVGHSAATRDPYPWAYTTFKIGKDGVRDDTFGTGGCIESTEYAAYDISKYGSGKYLLSGENTSSWTSWYGLFNSDGGQDTAFFGTGMLEHLDSEAVEEAIYATVVSSSGYITSAGVVYDGTVYDSDIGAWQLHRAYQIGSLPSGLAAFDESGNPIELGFPNGIVNGIVIIKDGQGRPIAEVQVSLGSDVDWSMVSGATDPATGKSYVTGLDTAPGAFSHHALYVPKLTGNNAVYICPSAVSLEQVTPDCSGKIVKKLGDEGVSIISIGGQDYWRVEDMTTTGGLSRTGDGLIIAMVAGVFAVCSPIARFIYRRRKI